MTSVPQIDYDGLIRHADDASQALIWMAAEITGKQEYIEDSGEREYLGFARRGLTDALKDLIIAVARLESAAEERGVRLGAEEESNDLPF